MNMSTTGRLVRRDVPKSPFIAAMRYLPNCTGTGSRRPSRVSSSCTSCAVASPGSRRAAGLPLIRVSVNTMTTRAKSINMPCHNLLQSKRATFAPMLANQGRVSDFGLA